MDDQHDDFGDAWDRMSEQAAGPGEMGEGAEGDDGLVDAGPPVRVTLVLRAESIPVAPWAQGWAIRAAGPIDGHVTLLCEHDVHASPVAQLAAVTGLLSTVKQAQLQLEWWAIQTRAPLPGEHDAAPDLDQELAQLLEDRDDESEA